MFTGIYCQCPRSNVTVGKLDMGSADIRYQAAKAAVTGLPLQCDNNFEALQPGAGADPALTCFGGVAAATINGTDFDETATRLCEACASDVKCDGWALLDNVTGTTFRKGKPTKPPPGRSCTALVRVNAEWINVGGDWVSTPGKGECRGSAVPGDGTGCSWMVKDKPAVKYVNQSCLDGHVDAVVLRAGADCFKGCSGGWNTTCHIRCYAKTVAGDPFLGVAPLSQGLLTTVRSER